MASIRTATTRRPKRKTSPALLPSDVWPPAAASPPRPRLQLVAADQTRMLSRHAALHDFLHTRILDLQYLLDSIDNLDVDYEAKGQLKPGAKLLRGSIRAFKLTTPEGEGEFLERGDDHHRISTAEMSLKPTGRKATAGKQLLPKKLLGPMRLRKSQLVE